MEIRRLTRSDEDFYTVMGPIFGSRLIEKQTKDRFYDDPAKVWFVIPGKGAASLLDCIIKNFWAVNDETADTLVSARVQEQKWLDGVLPRTYEDVFKRHGFETSDHRVNFIEVYRHEKD